MTSSTAPRLPALLWQHRRDLFWGALLLLATNAAERSIPWCLGAALDAFRGADLPAVRRWALGAVFIAALLWIVRTASRVKIFSVGRDIEYELRNRLAEHLHRLGPLYLQRVSAGDLMNRAVGDLGQVRLMLGFGALNLVNSLMALATTLVPMFWISPRLSLFALLPYPILVVVVRYFGSRLYRASRASQDAISTLNEGVREAVAAARFIRASALEEGVRSGLSESNGAVRARNQTLVVLRSLMGPTMTFLGASSLLIVLWLGSPQVLRGELSVGRFVAFLTYLGQLLWPTLALGYLISVLERGRASYERLREVFEATPPGAQSPAEEVKASASAPSALASESPLVDPAEDKNAPALRVRGLAFAYDTHAVLQDIDFEVPRGAFVALVGPTGSGKSTLAALLAGVLPPSAGNIELFGEALSTFDPARLRRRLSYCPQDGFLFSKTIRENLAYALERPLPMGIRDEGVEQTLNAACLSSEIERLPQGLETLIGERGVQLSGGQRQRLALARSWLLDAPLMVLDDPFSAVDAWTEAQILAALRRNWQEHERSIVLVTHRMAAAREAELILVLDGGRIVARGDHESLMRDPGGVYAEMVRLQQWEAGLEELRSA